MGKKKKGEGSEREKKNSSEGEQEKTDEERRKESCGEGVDKPCESSGVGRNRAAGKKIKKTVGAEGEVKEEE